VRAWSRNPAKNLVFSVHDKKTKRNLMKTKKTITMAQPKHIPSQQQTLLQPQRML